MRLTRRRFLEGSLAALALAGCGSAGGDDDAGLARGDDDGGGGGGGEPDGAPEPPCPDDPLAGGMLVGTVALLDNGSPTFGKLYGSGLDARKMVDLATVPETPVTPLDAYYLRTGLPDALPAADGWKVSVGGLVDAPLVLGVDELVAAAKDQGTFVMECSGNDTGGSFGLMSAGRWRGVPVADVLARVKPQTQHVMFEGYDRHDGPSETSYPGAAWVFSLDQLKKAGAFLATHLDGEPLTPEHGAPVRLYVPNWYGCVCIKWLQTITVVDDDVAPPFQMLEFAHRVMQDGEPKLARDWAPAIIDQAAMPVRVEKWSVGGKVRYRVLGIMWGGETPTDRLQIRYNDAEPWQAVTVCPTPQTTKTNKTWTVWSTVWDPPGPGTYTLRCHFDDASIRQRRMDSGWYARRVKVT